MEYASGEESIISLVYENLGNHCSICKRLTHLQSQCPEKTSTDDCQQTNNILSRRPTQPRHLPSPPPKNRDLGAASTPEPFQKRRDRHGRPFGERISTASFRPPGPRNKIAPDSAQHYIARGKLNTEGSARDEYSSPPYTRRRLNDYGRHQDGRNLRDRNGGSPTLQWRAKSPILAQEVTPPSEALQPPRQSVG